MIEALERNGWAVNREPLEKRTAAGLTVGRPHLAEAVFNDARNADRVEREQLRTPTDLLVAYLIEGRPAYREREAPTVELAIALIHGAGGVAVWAHPFWDVEAEAEVLSTLERFTAAGLDGVEAFYVTHTQAQTDLLVAAAHGAWPSDHRFVRLPRSKPQTVQPLPCIPDLRPPSEPWATGHLARR